MTRGKSSQQWLGKGRPAAPNIKWTPRKRGLSDLIAKREMRIMEIEAALQAISDMSAMSDNDLSDAVRVARKALGE